jgi:outer membrane protein, heavy metal efflux system
MSSRSVIRAALALAAVLVSYTAAGAEPLDGGLNDPGPRAPGSEIPAQTVAQSPVGELTLRQAVASALVGNPELAVFSGEVRAREAAIVQARLLPNPELDVTAANLGNDVLRDFDGPQATVSLSQIILMGGKRAAGVRVAGLDRDLAAWDYEVKRLDVLTRVAQAFVAVLQAQQGRVLANDLVALAERVVAAVAARVQAGKSSPVEESRARVALGSIGIERERAARELEAARTGLAATWGSTAPRFTKALGRLEDIHPVPAVEDLAGRLRQNPDLARWASELAGREANLDLERRRAVPDLTATLGITHFTETDDSALIAGISIPLPILNRNQGNIRAAHERLAKAMAERRAAEVSITTGLHTAYQRLAGAHAEIAALKAQVLPGAQSAFEAATRGYRLGKFGLLDVLDAQRTLFEAKAQYLRALTDYHQSVAQVERLIGERLEAVQTQKESR